MSWNGKHPVVSREYARSLLPPAACRICVYYVRCFPQAVATAALARCTRCQSRPARPKEPT